MKAPAIGVSPVTLSPSGAGVIQKRKIWSAPVHHLRRKPSDHVTSRRRHMNPTGRMWYVSLTMANMYKNVVFAHELGK